MTEQYSQPLDQLAALLRTPQVLADRYELRSHLGRGGMGIVYLGFDLVLRREVAIKFVEPALSDDMAAVHLQNEAQLIAELAHPGIVPIHDLGQLDDGTVYYVMEVVRGETLAAWTGNEHSLQEKLRLFDRICQPVSFAHARGIAHRDLKPTNIMIGEFGQVLVMDWGLARRCTTVALTDADARVGTPGYRPPINAAGSNLIAADVYALGAVLYFMLVGRDPEDRADGHSAVNWEEALSGLHPRASNPRIDKRLNAICEMATSLDPLQRYPSMRELQADVASYLDGSAVRAFPERWHHIAQRWIERNAWLLALLGAYLFMRIVVAIFSA